MPARLVIFCVISLICRFATAQPAATPPATAPATTQAAIIPADQSTPRGALKVLTTAMNKGDAAGINAIFVPSNDDEHKIVNAVIAQQQAVAKFRSAAVASLGADEAMKLVGDGDGDEIRAMVTIEGGKEEITGDTATVTMGEVTSKLTKQNGKWTVPISILVPPMSPAAMDAELIKTAQTAKIFDELSAELAKGTYKNASEAGKALQAKVMQQRRAELAPATQPTTAPATPPAAQ